MLDQSHISYTTLLERQFAQARVHFENFKSHEKNRKFIMMQCNVVFCLSAEPEIGQTTPKPRMPWVQTLLHYGVSME